MSPAGHPHRHVGSSADRKGDSIHADRDGLLKQRTAPSLEQWTIALLGQAARFGIAIAVLLRRDAAAPVEAATPVRRITITVEA